MALAAMLFALAWMGAATAAGQTQVDESFTDGTPSDTEVLPPGDLALAPSFDVSDEFNGTDLPMGWETFAGAPWTGAPATVAGGFLTVDGARANTAPPPAFTAGRSMDFGATFTADPFQHVGLGVAFEDGPWAMFSTGGGALAVGLYARTLTAPGGTAINTPIDDIDPLAPHDYGIEWTPTEVRFFVDGVLVATNAAAITAQMRPVASDLNGGGGNVDVDYVDLYSYPASGTFMSRVFDAGGSPATWLTLDADVDTPAGTNVSFETRTGPTPTPDASWTAFEAVGSAGEVAGPPGDRYLQYRATLTTTDTSLTPAVERVFLDYEVDDTEAPNTTIGGVTVSGNTARVTFSSEAGATFECSLDNGPFQPCTSPRQYTGLAAGGHTVRVRAIDTAGNVGTAVSRSFSISSQPSTPPPSGGGNTPPTSGGGTGEPPDTTAARVRPKPRSVKVSKRGRFRVRLRCPGDEERCWIMLRVRYRGELIATKRVIVRGGRTVRVVVRLKPLGRDLLEERPRLRVFAFATARDASGNRATTRTRMTLRAG